MNTITTLPNTDTRDTTLSVPRKHWNPKSARPWTKEDDALLMACAANGLSHREAARVLGRSRNAVGYHASKRGVLFTQVHLAAMRFKAVR
jgi:hypothetical protein